MSDTTRRIFLEVIGAGTATCALHQAGCLPASPDGSAGTGGGGATGSGGAAGSGGGSGGQRAMRDSGIVPGPDDLVGPHIDDLPVGTILQVPAETVAVARDAGGIYALVLLCTHMGCAIAPSDGSISNPIDCPCHGSRFDGTGAVLRGPALRPLTHLAVDVDESGFTIVHTLTTVDAATRLSV